MQQLQMQKYWRESSDLPSPFSYRRIAFDITRALFFRDGERKWFFFFPHAKDTPTLRLSAVATHVRIKSLNTLFKDPFLAKEKIKLLLYSDLLRIPR